MALDSNLYKSAKLTLSDYVTNAVRDYTNNKINLYTDITDTTTTGNYFRTNSATTTTAVATSKWIIDTAKTYQCDLSNDRMKLESGQEMKIEMPDGSIIEVDENGNYKIIDKDAKVTYKACKMREFNRYVNASDLLEEFIVFLGRFDVRQSEVLNVPIETFINWLILRAAEEDGVEDDDKKTKVEKDVKLLAGPEIRAQCRVCGRWLPDENIELEFHFCDSDCAVMFAERRGLGARQRRQAG